MRRVAAAQKSELEKDEKSRGGRLLKNPNWKSIQRNVAQKSELEKVQYSWSFGCLRQLFYWKQITTNCSNNVLFSR